MTGSSGTWVEPARRIAAEVLFPAASSVDETGQVPAGHW